MEYKTSYALRPIWEIVGRDPMGELEYDIVAYVATRCYIITLEQGVDLSLLEPYEIVYETNLSDLSTKQEPLFDSKGKCINSVKTNMLFDSFDDAKVAEYYRNRELVRLKNQGQNASTELKDFANVIAKINEYTKFIDADPQLVRNLEL